MYFLDEMKEEYYKQRKKDMAFVEIDNSDHEPKISLYVWSQKLENQYQHLFISPQVRMTEDEEKIFTQFCKKKRVQIEQKKIQEIYNIYSMEYPEIHLYPYKSGMHMLHHIYCALHEGVEELLYKANLGFLALYLNEIDDYNMIGTNPSAVFDGLPMHILRVLNTPQGIRAIRTEKQRDMLYSLFMKSPKLFRFMWSVGQCEYFSNIICGEATEGFFVEHGKKLEYLAVYRTRKDYENLVRYEEKVKLLKGHATLPVIPDVCGTSHENLFYKADYLYEVLVQEAFNLNWKLELQYAMDTARLEFQKGDYLICCPRSVEEIYRESVKQQNCLWEYIKKVADGETTILFLRKKDAPEEAFVTIELYSGLIFQARGRYNQVAGERELDWLEDYAKEKNLIFIREELM